MNISEKTLNQIKTLCKLYKVKSLSLFGSAIRDDFNDLSDIDFAVDFNEKDPIKYSDLYYDLKEKLEILLKRKIDLIEIRAIKNRFFKKELDETNILIYEQ